MILMIWYRSIIRLVKIQSNSVSLCYLHLCVHALLCKSLCVFFNLSIAIDMGTWSSRFVVTDEAEDVVVSVPLPSQTTGDVEAAFDEVKRNPSELICYRIATITV